MVATIDPYVKQPSRDSGTVSHRYAYELPRTVAHEPEVGHATESTPPIIDSNARYPVSTMPKNANTAIQTSSTAKPILLRSFPSSFLSSYDDDEGDDDDDDKTLLEEEDDDDGKNLEEEEETPTPPARPIRGTRGFLFVELFQ